MGAVDLCFPRSRTGMATYARKPRPIFWSWSVHAAGDCGCARLVRCSEPSKSLIAAPWSTRTQAERALTPTPPRTLSGQDTRGGQNRGGKKRSDKPASNC